MHFGAKDYPKGGHWRKFCFCKLNAPVYSILARITKLTPYEKCSEGSMAVLKNQMGIVGVNLIRPLTYFSTVTQQNSSQSYFHQVSLKSPQRLRDLNPASTVWGSATLTHGLWSRTRQLWSLLMQLLRPLVAGSNPSVGNANTTYESSQEKYCWHHWDD